MGIIKNCRHNFTFYMGGNICLDIVKMILKKEEWHSKPCHLKLFLNLGTIQVLPDPFKITYRLKNKCYLPLPVSKLCQIYVRNRNRNLYECLQRFILQSVNRLSISFLFIPFCLTLEYRFQGYAI